MKLVPMKFSSKEAKENTTEAMEMKAPEYPYGLSIYLNTESLKKLGIGDISDFELGEQCYIVAIAKVIGTSENQYEGGEPEMCLNIQITDMSLSTDSKEAEEEKPKPRTKLYGNDDA